jgi:diguanylate cyclase (GGDEF)-like protein/PAS domain S-box-containing protein
MIRAWSPDDEPPPQTPHDARSTMTRPPAGVGNLDAVERLVAAHGVEATAALYRALFDALDEGFCVVEMIRDESGADVDYRFVEVNAAFERHAGIVGAHGRTILELVPDIERHWIDLYGRVARSGEPSRFEAETATSDTHVWFDEYAFRLGGPESRHVAIHFTDITARRHVEEENRHRAEQFRTLVDRAPVGVFLLDADLCLLEVNPAARAMVGGVEGDAGRPVADLLRTVWPERVAAATVALFRRTLATGEGYHDPDFSERRADRGTVEHYDWSVERIQLPDGSHGLVCYFRDTSAAAAARARLAASEARYRTLFESIDEGFCILHVLFDAAGRPVDYRYVEVNPAFERQTGITGALGRTITELVPDIEPYWFDVYGAVARTGEPRRFVDHAPSMGRWFDVYAFRIGAPEEHRVAVLFADVTARKRTEGALRESVAQLRHHAHHDALTGLPNRILFEDRLALAVAAAARHQRPLALLFVDVDGFKGVNDALGHAGGDAVLAAVARRLGASLRACDTLARLHGDEFVVLLPEIADPADVEALAATLGAQVAEPIEVDGRVVQVSASIGIGHCPSDAVDAAELLRAADVAMYRAKLAGGNRACSSATLSAGVAPESTGPSVRAAGG